MFSKQDLCFQNKTYDAEKKLGILWAPSKDNAGRTKHHWERLKKLQQGDVVFNYVSRPFVGACIVQGSYEKSLCPFKSSEWHNEGYMVRVKYFEFDMKIDMNDQLYSQIKASLPDKYSPFSFNGKGNQGYLYEIPKELAFIIRPKLRRFEND